MLSRLGIRMGIFYESNSVSQRLHWYLLAGGKGKYSWSSCRDFYAGRTNVKHDCYADSDILFLENKTVNLQHWSAVAGA